MDRRLGARDDQSMPEIRVDTILELIANSHAAYTVCPCCQESRDVDLDRLVRKGLGERSIRSIRIRCVRCSTRLGRDIEVKIMTPGYRKGPEREVPDNVVSMKKR